MKNLVLITLCLILVLSGCSDAEDINKSENINNDMTFAEVEELFSMKTSFSELSKIGILDRFGSVKDYYDRSV